MITFEALPGDDIRDTIDSAIQLNADYGQKVHFDFNGIRFCVQKNASANDLYNYYNLALKYSRDNG